MTSQTKIVEFSTLLGCQKSQYISKYSHKTMFAQNIYVNINSSISWVAVLKKSCTIFIN